MSPAEAMQHIEGLRFSALTNLASDLKTFLHILGDQEEVQTLALAMREGDVARQVMERVLELSGTEVDAEYEHPADAALAAYLWLFSQQPGTSCQVAAKTVLACRQCWWARKIAERLIQEAASQVA